MTFISPFYRKPKTLGEGLKRIVNKAGGTTDATIVSHSPTERIYSNGVRIVSKDRLKPTIRKDISMDSALYIFKPNAPKTNIQGCDIYALKGTSTAYADEKKSRPIAQFIDKVVGESDAVRIRREKSRLAEKLSPDFYFDFKVKNRFAGCY
jgi:hypothetical protein